MAMLHVSQLVGQYRSRFLDTRHRVYQLIGHDHHPARQCQCIRADPAAVAKFDPYRSRQIGGVA